MVVSNLIPKLLNSENISDSNLLRLNTQTECKYRSVNARSLIYSPCHGRELSSPKFTLNEVKYVKVIVQGALDLACS